MAGLDKSSAPTWSGRLPGRVAVPCLAFFTLFLVFLEATAPAAAPDELSHFIRLGGIVRGQWIGPVPESVGPLPHFSEAQARRVQLEAGVFSVSPRYLYISGDNCTSNHPLQPTCARPRPPDVDGVTRQTSLHGRGLIAGYLAPAAFSAFGWSGRSTFFLARLGMASMAAALLALAILAVTRVDPSATIPVITGIAVAYTPLAAYLSGVISPSAVGIAGNVALLCTTWALLRSKERSKERSKRRSSGRDLAGQGLWLVALAAACGAQRIGYVFAAMAVLAGLLSAGAAPWLLWRRLSWGALAAAILIGVGAFLWDFLTAVRLPSEDSILSLRTLFQHAGSVWTTTQQAASSLGFLEVTMPAAITALWAALYAWCVMGAMLLSERRWTASVAILLLVYFCIGIALVHAYKPTGFGLQARFFLPGILLLPVASLLHLATIPGRPWRRLNPCVLYGLCALGMIGAEIVLVRRHVVGMGGPYWFFDQGEFRPLGGWLLFGITVAIFLIFVFATLRGPMTEKSRDTVSTGHAVPKLEPAKD